MEHIAERIRFDFVPDLPFVLVTQTTHMGSEAGMIPVLQFNGRIGFTESGGRRIADLHDPRDPPLISGPLQGSWRRRWRLNDLR